MRWKVFLLFLVLLLVLTVSAQVSRGPTRVILTQARETTTQSFIQNPFFIFLILASIVLFIFWKKIKDKRIYLILGLGAIWGIFFLGYAEASKQQPIPIIETDWQKEYALATSDLPEEYLEKTNMYDYDDPEIQMVIKDITEDAVNAEDAVYMALQYTYFNVNYNRDESDNICFIRSASDVLSYGSGQCDTQSRLNIALLRGMGIMARPVGGCIYSSAGCNVKFNIYAIMGIPLTKPKWEETTPEEFEKGVFSRKVEEADKQLLSRGGGLHAWLEIYLPGKGWVIAESTAGVIMTSSCIQYNIELYPSNYDTEQFCVSKNLTYARMCANQ